MAHAVLAEPGPHYTGRGQDQGAAVRHTTELQRAATAGGDTRHQDKGKKLLLLLGKGQEQF